MGRPYAFNKKTKEPLFKGNSQSNSDITKADLLSGLTPKQKANAVILKVNEGVVVARLESPQLTKGKLPNTWWVLRDNPELRGTDIKNPKQSFDQGNAPAVSFDFTGIGNSQFSKVTKRIAQRGADNAPPGVGADQASQHFAIILDNAVVSTPSINFLTNPDGISGGAQITGGFDISKAQDFASVLRIGALPVKLELISSSQVSPTLGQQSLDQGLIACLAPS